MRVESDVLFRPRNNEAVAFLRQRMRNLWGSRPGDRDLCSHFDHPSRRDLEIVGDIAGGAAEPDEQQVLPARHARMRGRLQRAAV